MSETWTVERLIKWTADFFGEKGLESPKLDAELLLGHTLGLRRVELYMQWDRPLNPDELAAFRALIKRRVAREPVAYLTGERAFWALDFKCDSRALIPRPDTEILVERVLELVEVGGTPSVLDVGCGTGCIGLTLAHEIPGAQVTLVDLSDGAVELTRENAAKHELHERVEVLKSDLMAAAPGPWDLVVSNPPYIATNEENLMDEDVLKYEPKSALFAGADGLDLIRPLAKQAFSGLNAGGWFLVEIGFSQGPKVVEILGSAGFMDVAIRKDYSGHDRVVEGQKP